MPPTMKLAELAPKVTITCHSGARLDWEKQDDWIRASIPSHSDKQPIYESIP